MAINYELINKGGISLGTNFELLSEKPLDSRLVVPSLAGLQNYIDNAAAYEGMIVFDKDTKKTYQVQTIDGVLSYRELGLTENELKNLIAAETTAAMEFKGAASALPENPSKGDMWKVTATFKVDDVDVKVGDAIVYNGEEWFVIPSGDDIEDTWRPVDGVANDATLKFAAGDKLDVAVANNGTITYSHEVIAAPELLAENEQTRTYITAVETDGHGHITGYKTATENVVDTNTEYTFESQVESSSVYFNVTPDAEGATEQTVYVNAYSKNEVDDKVKALNLEIYGNEAVQETSRIDTAVADAAEAKSTANTAAGDAAQAKTDAAEALSTANDAKTAATEAQTSAAASAAAAKASEEAALASQNAASASASAAEESETNAAASATTATQKATAASQSADAAAQAKTDAEAAQALASGFASAANESATAASEAKDAAVAAQGAAESAKDEAVAAQDAAESAKDEAIAKANAAAGSAGAAAVAAQGAAESASTAATKANDAEAARAAAVTAKEAAKLAETNANTILGQVTDAATGAQATANSAVETANAANKTAGEANTAAAGAVETANAAKAAADTAIENIAKLGDTYATDEELAAAVEAVKVDASNKDAVILAEAQKGIAAVQTNLDTHTANGDIHVTSDQKTAWNAAVQTITAAADSGLKATRTGNDVVIEINDDIVWVFNCGTSVI